MIDPEVQAAQDAIYRGDFAVAYHHINNLQVDGRHSAEVTDLQRRLLWRENAANHQGMNRLAYAIAVSVCGYGILSFQSPAGWGPVVWGLTAFFAIPLIAGVLVGNSVMDRPNQRMKSQRFGRAFLLVSVTVAIYTLIGLGWTRSKIQSADKSLDPAIFIVVTVVNGLVAGAVAGFASTIFPIRVKSS